MDDQRRVSVAETHGVRHQLADHELDVAGDLRLEPTEHDVGPDHLILGTRNQALPDPPGVSLGGQIYNVYELVHGRIKEIRDFAARKDALRAVGVEGEWR